MTITVGGLDVRQGEMCPPMGPTVATIYHIDVRPRGAKIVDVTLDGDVVTVFANGNGTGSVTISMWKEKAGDPEEGGGIVALVDTRNLTGIDERKVIGARSVINPIGVAINEDVTVLAPSPRLHEFTTEVEGPEKDCQE